MLRYAVQLLQKVLDKDWNQITASWIWIYQYVRKYWLQIVFYTGMGLFGTAVGLLSSVVSKNLIDAVTGAQSGSIGWAVAAYIGLGISEIFINLFTGKLSLLVQTKVQHEIQADVFDQVMTTDWEAMSDYTTGDLLVRTNGDAMTIASSVLSFLPNAVTTLCRFAGAFAIVCWHDPWMALIALAGAPITFLTSRYRLTGMQKFQKESWALSGKKMTFNQETFQNIQSIKAFNLTELFSDRMRHLQKDTLELSLRQYRYQSVSNIIMSLTGLLVGYACYGFAIFRLWQGEISFGTMTLFVSMASSLSGAFSGVIHLVPTAIRAATCAERIREIIELPRENMEDADRALQLRKKAQTDGVYLAAENLSFVYKDGRPVYEHGAFEAHPGEIVALIGPSGHGKTTTLRLLLGLLQPTTGSLTVGNPGGDHLSISPSTRCLFSYVPQGNTIFSGTIAENLRMVNPEATDQQLIEVLKQACAWEFVQELDNGIDTKIGERGHGFSEGQNQRISIARALLSGAPILLLDESTSALDLATEEKVLHNIIRRDPHRIILVTAHRPSVLAMCSRVYRIQNGTMTQVQANDEKGRIHD